jgi:hypothetical protein
MIKFESMGPKPQALNLIELSRSNKSQFLKAILDGLNYDGFRFPTAGVDGCIGNCCISKAQIVSFPGTQKKAALHLNFTCVPGAYAPGTLNLAITHFHLTARPQAGQLLINDAGSSILTAQDSIHVNRNGDWGRAPNIANLANALGITTAALLSQLRTTEGYNTAYMGVAVNAIKQAIQTTVGINAGQTTITWNNSDSTFL